MVKKNTLTREEKNRITRKLSIKEGSAASVMGGVGDSYIVPFALALNASNVQIGLISSLAGLFGPLSQIFGSRLIEKHHRKTIISKTIFLQASMWIAFILLGLLYLSGIISKGVASLFILTYVVYVIVGSMGGPAWFSMMGDITSERGRGKYFSKRNRIHGTISLTATILAALWLDLTKSWSLIIFGFLVLFSVASIARYISYYYFRKHYVPEIKLEKGYHFSFWKFARRAPFNNFGRFVIYIALMNFTFNLAGPFFAVYLLSGLGLNYLWFTLIVVSAGFFSVLFVPMWGRFADKYGNRELMKITGLMSVMIPILWTLSPNPIYLILVPQLVAGLSLSGFGLSSSNFIFDAVTAQKRAIIVAYNGMFSGIAIFVGAGLGGLFSQYVEVPFMSTLFLLFILSGLLRLLVFAIMIPKIKEVRVDHEPSKKNPLMYLEEIKPIYGSLKALMSPLSSVKLLSKKIERMKKSDKKQRENNKKKKKPSKAKRRE